MIARYSDPAYGEINIDFEDRYIEDNLDRDAIWDESGHDYTTQQHIYADILRELAEEAEGMIVDTEVVDFGVRGQVADTGEWLYLEAGARTAYIL